MRMITVQGTVHGRTIQVEEDLGVTEGQKVEIQIKVLESPTR